MGRARVVSVAAAEATAAAAAMADIYLKLLFKQTHEELGRYLKGLI